MILNNTAKVPQIVAFYKLDQICQEKGRPPQLPLCKTIYHRVPLFRSSQHILEEVHWCQQSSPRHQNHHCIDIPLVKKVE